MQTCQIKRVLERKAVFSTLLMLGLTALLFMGCARVINDFINDPDSAPPPSIESLQCPEPTGAEGSPPAVSFLGAASNAFEGRVKDDNSRRDGAPTAIKICFDPLPSRVLGVGYQITEEGAARDTDYILSAEDGLGESRFLFIRPGQEDTVIEVAALGDANNGESDVGALVIELLAGEAYTLGAPSQHRVEVLDPFDVELGFALASSRVNEDNLDPDVIVIEAAERTPVDLPVRVRFSIGTVQADEIQITGWSAVSGTSDQYDVIMPAGGNSASISIDAFFDADRGTEDLTFELTEPTDRHSQKYTLNTQTRHTATVVSRVIVGFDRIGRFDASLLPGGVVSWSNFALGPDGDVYVSGSTCIRRFTFTPAADGNPARLMNQGLGNQPGQGLIGTDTSGQCRVPNAVDPWMLNSRMVGAAYVETAEIDGKHYLFALGGRLGEVNMVAYRYDTANDRYNTSFEHSATDITNNNGAEAYSLAIDISNNKIYVELPPRGAPPNNTEVNSIAFEFNGQGQFRFRTQRISTWEGLLPSTLTLGANYVSSSQSIAANPHNQDIYVLENNGGATRNSAQFYSESNSNTEHLFIFRDGGTPNMFDWSYLDVYNEDGLCGRDDMSLSADSDVIVGPDGTVYVADAGNFRVQLFNTEENGGLTPRRDANNEAVFVDAKPSQLIQGTFRPGMLNVNAELGNTGCVNYSSTDNTHIQPNHITIDQSNNRLYSYGLKPGNSGAAYFNNATAYVHVYDPIYVDP